MLRLTLLSLLLSISFLACIKDDFITDFVDPELRITTSVDTISVNTSFQFESIYFNNVGVNEAATVEWSSSNPDIISIDNTGLAQANAIGSAVITAAYDNGSEELTDMLDVNVGQNTVTTPTEKMGSIATTSTYALTGDFVLKEDGNNLVLEFSSNYVASSALPGLYVYLSNNRNTTSNAYEIAAVQVFSGAHSYTIPNVSINDYRYVLYYCKPFSVKVGDGEIQ